MFGATIYRPTAELNCIHASGTTSGDTTRVWTGQLMPPGTSVTKGISGYCQLSNGNRTATLYGGELRSEEHTSELQSLMRTSYAVFCLKQKMTTHQFIYLSNT